MVVYSSRVNDICVFCRGPFLLEIFGDQRKDVQRNNTMGWVELATRRTRDFLITWLDVFCVIRFFRSASSSSLGPNMIAVRFRTFRTGIAELYHSPASTTPNKTVLSFE